MTRAAAMLVAITAALPAQAPPGELIDVGGYRMHLYCTGEGSPTVVLSGALSFDWALVQPDISKSTRVCSYDMSGTAFSDPRPAPPSCSSRVDEINRVLTSAHIDPPYIFTGLSAGALFARLYAKDYPNEVAALVFIDHAFTPTNSAPPPIVTGPDSPPSVISMTPIEFGIEDEPAYDKLPESARALHRWAISRHPQLPTPELADECIATLRNANLGNLPLVVVSTANDTPGYSELQTSLLALSHNSHQLIADKSFHSIEISQPEIVVDAIHQAILLTTHAKDSAPNDR
jgi:pimeloyl-ACP methyl ester carboxylesterase